jgi:hypothetical protein
MFRAVDRTMLDLYRFAEAARHRDLQLRSQAASVAVDWENCSAQVTDVGVLFDRLFQHANRAFALGDRSRCQRLASGVGSFDGAPVAS